MGSPNLSILSGHLNVVELAVLILSQEMTDEIKGLALRPSVQILLVARPPSLQAADILKEGWFTLDEVALVLILL
jgi:hypothetical protein